LPSAAPAGQAAGVIEVRVLSVEDWRAWRELRLAALAEAPYAFGSTLAEWQGDGDREERWRNRLAIAGSYNLLALLDGQPAGMASGVPGERPGTVELISLWVGPAARGRGVGDRLIHAVADWARASTDARVLELAVRSHNANALALYRRHGFADTGRPGERLPDGGHELVLAKPLTAPRAVRP
jgi:ribosomal protein S18 acetylase RimI-like enzyme